MSSKKITYSSDFKLKVLDYYFKHGGDDKFGLKKKTAGHFNIDKKTINRMLNNPDMVKRARKLLTARKATASAKASPSSTRHHAKPAVRRAGAAQNKPSQSSASSSSSNKASTSSTSSTKTVNSRQQAGNTTSRQQASNTTSRQQASNTGSRQQASNANSKQTSNTTSSSNKSTPQKTKPGIPENKGSPGVEVFELPEDPDYSLLKRSINAATNGVASLAKLLVTGTEEVRSVVLNECDVILECKVCRNLFRSVVNFLAHKRIYCQEEFADVRTLFHKGDVQGVTSQSNTVVVEPEPPPEKGNINTMRTMLPTTYTSPMISVAQGRTRRSGIDSIALKLARKRKAYHASSLSSSTSSGSPSYFQTVSEVSRSRDKLSRDCSVVLEDIGGVTNAVFQTFVPPGSPSPSTSMSTMVDEAAHSKSGISVAINRNGDIVKTASGDITSMDVDQSSISSDSRDLTCLLCNTRFATQKTLSVHQRSHHGFERCIYSCPICQASFLSMWAVVKHLQRTHKKTKNQIERLRKVVRKNVRKKIIYQKVEKNKDSSEPLKNLDGDDEDEDEGEEDEVEDSSASPSKTSEVVSPKKSGLSSPMETSPVKPSSHKNDEPRLTGSPDHRCVKCDRKFNTPCALVSHDKFCSLMQMALPETPMNTLLRSETPEKKIAIQIRKDYKKPVPLVDHSTPSFSEAKYTQVMFKVPKTPQEKENQSKIEEMMSEFCDLSSLSCIPCGRKYQTVTTLKRHAACHVDWTRFECNLCHYRNYHRYEVINHCIVKHQVKENIAGGMVVQREFVGQLKYFLDNEDTSASSDIEQDQDGEHCISDISSVCDKNDDTSSYADGDIENNPSLEVKDTGNSEEEMPLSSTGNDQTLPECQVTEENYISTDENSRECKGSQVKDENSKGCKGSEMKDENIHHQKMDENNISETALNKPKEPVFAPVKTLASESLAEVQNPSDTRDKMTIDKRLHVEDSSPEKEIKEESEEEKGNEMFSEEDDRLNKQDTESLCEEDSDSNPNHDAMQSKELSIKENICIQDFEVSNEINIPKDSGSPDKLLGVGSHELDTQNSYCSTGTTENASIPDDHDTKKLLDIDKDQNTLISHNREENQNTVVMLDVGEDPIIEKNEYTNVKVENTEKIQDAIKENTSQDDTNNTVVTDKLDDSESISSCLETSEQECVTECSEHTAASQSISANNFEDNDILLSESESEVLVDEFKETEIILERGESIEWRTSDESQDLLDDTKDLDLQAFQNQGLDFCRFEGMEHPNFNVPFKIEKDIKPVPKDDLSLELKDFVGFPSTKDEIFERPHRMRRSIEHKDFIYDSKKPITVKIECDDEDNCDSLPTEKPESKLEGGRFSLRRRSSLKSEVVPKKSKDEDEEYKQESCNGSSFECTISKKNETYSVSPKKGSDVDTSVASGASSVERRKVRLVRRRLDTSPHGNVTLHVDGSKAKASDSSKGKNLENISESNGTGSKSLVKNESPSTKRYSSRLKMASSPVPKKDKKQDLSNVCILINGQGQSNSVVTSSKVKL